MIEVVTGLTCALNFDLQRLQSCTADNEKQVMCNNFSVH